MDGLSIDQVNNFAKANDVILNEHELNFTYDFVKKNWETILGNPNLLNLERYKHEFTSENYEKIQKLIKVYYQKYHNYL